MKATNNPRWLAVFLTLFICLLQPSYGAPAESPAPKASPSSHPDVPIYLSYIKDPASLGFAPDNSLLQEVYQRIKSEHIDRHTDEQLYNGVLKQVGELLKESKLDSDQLAHMAPDRSLPEHIVNLYGPRVNQSLLYYAMIRGLLEGTDDPYSVLWTPREYQTQMEQLQSASFGGIGIYIELDHEQKDQLTVVEPLEGTPAYKAGLLAGDQILKINGKDTKGLSLDDATALIRGKIGTQVVLTIHRGGTEGTSDYAITRANIEMISVSEKVLPNDIAYVKVRLFGAKTGEELAQALQKAQENGAKGLVLDLRNNPGGYITAAVDVCGNFVNPGALVTFVTRRSGEREDYNARGHHPAFKLPMVLLINNFSASASEITAGCLKDYHLAEIVGVKSFGKGSVQNLFQLPNGAALKLTIAHFFTPRGDVINKVGVTPDITVEMEPRNAGRGLEKDTQLKAALDYLQKKG